MKSRGLGWAVEGRAMVQEFDVAVVGQVARDLVLLVDETPGPAGTVPVRERREMLGGKGANQAVACAQLGASVALVGVVGDDRVGEEVRAQARRDGIDVRHVVRRGGTATGLIVSAVEADGRWRYFEDLPSPVLLTEADVAAAADVVSGAGSVLLQLQQPGGAVVAAARLARAAGRRVVLDGAPAGEHRDEVLACADVLRADAREAEQAVGAAIEGAADAVRAGRELLRAGPSLVVLAVGEEGNAVVWGDGDAVLPLADAEVVDTTGAGDAFTAALTLALARGAGPVEAGERATQAAGATVRRLGGRPDLSPEVLGPR